VEIMARSKTGFSSVEVARITGLSVRQIQYWTATGFVRASVYDAPGCGHHRRYDFRDVLTFIVLAELRAGGVSLQALRQAQRFIRSRSGRDLRDVHAKLVWAPGNRSLRRDLALVYSETEIESLIDVPGQQVAAVAIPVGELYEQARRRIKEIRSERKAKLAKSKQKRAEKEKQRAKTVQQRRRKEKAA